MNQLLPMRSTLVELEKSIDAKDVLKIGQAAGRLLGPVNALYNEPRPTDAAKQKLWDTMAGPCLVLIDRCRTKLKALDPMFGLRRIFFNPDVVDGILVWAAYLIDPETRRPDWVSVPDDTATPLATPTPPADASESLKPG